MIAELWRWLLVSTLASSVAIVLVLLLRRPLRRVFGCRAAYTLWLMPALAMLVCLVPLPARPTEWVAIVAEIIHVGTGNGSAMLPDASWSLAQPGVAVWVLGVAVMTAMLVRSQRRFRRRLGRLQHRDDGCWHAIGWPQFGPAIIGLMPTRIVIPADFETRFDRQQRDLILAHERRHITRGDLWVQWLALIMRCLFWFNPLVHGAARIIRFDQELACDAGVIGKHRVAARQYAEAMLVMASPLSPSALLYSTWVEPDHLKERITMLGNARIGNAVRLMGTCLIATFALCFALGVWAVQGPVANSSLQETDDPAFVVDLALSFSTTGDDGSVRTRSTQVVLLTNQSFAVSGGDDDTPWHAEFELTELPNNQFDVRARMYLDGKVFAMPGLRVMADRIGSMSIEGLYEITLKVSRRTEANDPRREADAA